ncbi:MAG: Gfo/Idh/MocA family protein [Planctomycetaceae bacterium]
MTKEMVSDSPIRIGIVGAGNNTRTRHVPGFRAIDGVAITGVVNRSPESTRRVAEEFDIPRQFENWEQLVESDDVDAVLIGTWPYRHCEITCAALEAGKHVLCEARMAGDAAEAHRMLETSRRHSHLTAQIVPSPFGLAQHEYVLGLLNDGFLGELRELIVIGATDLWGDASQPLHWRQETQFSGRNALALGILHEAAMRWTPPTIRVFAQAATFETARPASDRSDATIADVPDSVQIVTQLQGGARGLYHLSGVSRFGPGKQIHLYGSRGTIKLLLSPDERLLIGSAGDAELREPDIPPEQRGGWRVEAEFIGSIRGEETVRFTDFETGVRYMEFTDAVHQSAAENRPVDLPLQGDR